MKEKILIVEDEKYVKTDIYYMMRSMRVVGDKWSEASVMGTKLKISF